MSSNTITAKEAHEITCTVLQNSIHDLKFQIMKMIGEACRDGSFSIEIDCNHSMFKHLLEDSVWTEIEDFLTQLGYVVTSNYDSTILIEWSVIDN